ncbi:MAG: class I SAM-dependent methyltransferase [Bdellovibrionaceae bacterium]|nr:class I SAM-dependent methyltransferase [Bdellovibrio sp.]
MGQEIDLLINYPRPVRNVEARAQEKSEEDRAIARRFGKEFFDGDRKQGYGGFNYMPRFWQPVVPTFQEFYNLNGQSSLLDVGCAKGFMLYDFAQLVPGIKVGGIDVSEYAIANAMESTKKFVQVANATSLPFADKSFDLVISINTVHNLDRAECAKALQEIERVGKRSYITVDAYRNEEEKKRMYAWNLTAKTIMSVEEWKVFFKEIGFTGDYFWFIP